MTLQEKVRKCKLCKMRIPLSMRNICQECRPLYNESCKSMTIERKIEWCKEMMKRLGFEFEGSKIKNEYYEKLYESSLKEIEKFESENKELKRKLHYVLKNLNCIDLNDVFERINKSKKIIKGE